MISQIDPIQEVKIMVTLIPTQVEITLINQQVAIEILSIRQKGSKSMTMYTILQIHKES